MRTARYQLSKRAAASGDVPMMRILYRSRYAGAGSIFRLGEESALSSSARGVRIIVRGVRIEPPLRESKLASEARQIREGLITFIAHTLPEICIPSVRNFTSPRGEVTRYLNDVHLAGKAVCGRRQTRSIWPLMGFIVRAGEETRGRSAIRPLGVGQGF